MWIRPLNTRSLMIACFSICPPHSVLLHNMVPDLSENQHEASCLIDMVGPCSSRHFLFASLESHS
jgi:hypothetical protein